MSFPLFLRYAIRESNSVVKIFKNFKEKKSFKPDFGAESECYLFMIHFENLCNGSEYLSVISLCPFKGIYGGFLLGVRSVNGLAFYDWDNTELIRRIEIQPKHVSVPSGCFWEVSLWNVWVPHVKKGPLHTAILVPLHWTPRHLPKKCSQYQFCIGIR